MKERFHISSFDLSFTTMSRCYECSKAITKRDDSAKIQCSVCKNWFHDKCIPLNKTDTDISHAKNEVWVCKYCAGQKEESSPIKLHETVPSILDIYNLLKRIETEFANKYSTLERINKETEQELGKSLDLVHEKLDENSRLIKQQAESIKSCLESIDGLKKENMLLKNKLEDTKAQLDDLEQYGRRNSIEIHGIPEMANENLLEIVKNIGRAMDIDIQPQMIDSCHRLGKSPGQPSAAVIVKFVRRMDKDQFIHRRKVKRNLKASQVGFSNNDNIIYINHSLTRLRRHIYSEARKLKKLKNFAYLWVDNAGNIKLRRQEGDRNIQILKTIDDVAKLA